MRRLKIGYFCGGPKAVPGSGSAVFLSPRDTEAFVMVLSAGDLADQGITKQKSVKGFIAQSDGAELIKKETVHHVPKNAWLFVPYGYFPFPVIFGPDNIAAANMLIFPVCAQKQPQGIPAEVVKCIYKCNKEHLDKSKENSQWKHFETVFAKHFPTGR